MRNKLIAVIDKHAHLDYLKPTLLRWQAEGVPLTFALLNKHTHENQSTGLVFLVHDLVTEGVLRKRFDLSAVDDGDYDLIQTADDPRDFRIPLGVHKLEVLHRFEFIKD